MKQKRCAELQIF